MIVKESQRALFIGTEPQECFIGTVSVSGNGYERKSESDLHVPEPVRKTPEFRNVVCMQPQFDGHFQVWLLSEYEHKAIVKHVHAAQ